MKTKKHGFYLWVWQEENEKILNYGCNGKYKSFAAADRAFAVIRAVHQEKLIRGEIRCEIS
jgi:L-amino acid N-acyltransferase YncA